MEKEIVEKGSIGAVIFFIIFALLFSWIDTLCSDSITIPFAAFALLILFYLIKRGII